MKRALFLILLCARGPWTQAASGNARTTGTCSPAVTGNNNVFTMTCEGVPKEQVQEMARLMNEILKQQLDPKQVYFQLNRIHSDLINLKVMSNPLSNAPPAAAALLKKSQEMQTACFEFAGLWNRALLEKMGQANQDRAQASAQRQADLLAYHPSRETDPLKAAADAERITEYKRVLAPELNRYEDAILARMRGTPRTDYSQGINNAADLMRACGALGFLTGSFMKTAGARDDDPVLRDWRLVRADCSNFFVKWNASYRVTRAGSSMTTEIVQNVDQEHAAEYQKTLAPELTAWRSQIVAQVPSKSSVPDYAAASSGTQIEAVCQDVTKLTDTYRQKIVDEVQNKYQLK